MVRAWEYDRQNHTVWSVDIHLEGEVLWAHPRIYNGNDHEIPGYWWTCVAMKATDGEPRCGSRLPYTNPNPSPPSPRDPDYRPSGTLGLALCSVASWGLDQYQYHLPRNGQV